MTIRSALPLREHISANAQALAAEHGATIEHIAKAHIRKEEVVANTYRYYLTRAGRLAIAAFERLTTFIIVPAMARA